MTGPPVKLAGYGTQVVQQRAQASPPGLGFCLNRKWRAPRDRLGALSSRVHEKRDIGDIPPS
jgi:hypothetical protein